MKQLVNKGEHTRTENFPRHVAEISLRMKLFLRYHGCIHYYDTKEYRLWKTNVPRKWKESLPASSPMLLSPSR